MTRYVFDNVHTNAVDRMASLASRYDPVTRQRLSAVGLAPGWRCLEIGAGGGSVARWLGEQVGETGSVLATDINTRLVGDVPSNVDVRVHDIVTDELPADEFDLVHARLVLIHLPKRAEALRRIRRALKPGGYLVLDEFDCTYLPVLAAPDKAARTLFDSVVTEIHAVLAEAGLDLTWGRNAYDAMRAAGFDDVNFAGWSEGWTGGSVGIAVHAANIGQVRADVLQRGVLSEQDIDAFLGLLDNPEFAVASYPLLTTWGRKPCG